MRVLVDTSVWSLVLRRGRKDLEGEQKIYQREITRLSERMEALLIGAIRQEILSGIRDPDTYERVRLALRRFEDESVFTEDYEEAASMSNRCRLGGIVGSSVDFLICAVAHRMDLPILTRDSDFLLFSQILPIRLHHPPPA
jgi:predicted nucleic acid-binding protein